MSGWFVTATGTEVGKTLVTATLIHQLRARGEAVTAIKPLLSGMADESLESCDAGILLRALGRDVTSETVTEITPWQFDPPISPDMAAAREGRSIDFAELCAFTERAGRAPGTLFVEGVGGAMVPIDKTHTVLDWIVASGLRPLVVAGSYLGTISHTLTTLATMRAAGVSPAALVVSASVVEPVPMDETLDTLRAFAGPVPIVGLPRLSGPEPWKSAPDLLEAIGA